jgi:hypothetical protein
MRYQLVLQFRGDSLADFDRIIAIEDRLIEELGRSAKVDGHDCGAGETNIFIYTSDPAATFWIARQVLESENQLDSTAAAYRPVEEGKQPQEGFIVIWPEMATREFRIA